MRYPLSRRLAALALTGAVVGLGACGDDGDADADRADFELSATGGSTDEANSGDAAEDDRPEVIGVVFPDPDDVVAEATFPVPGLDGEEVRIGVHSIVVTDEAMELRLVVTPLFDDGGPVSVYDMLQNGTGVIPTTLIDRAHLKEYTVLRDGGSRYETDPQLAEASEGESVGYQRFFAPPEDDIEVLDVKVHDDLPVFEDVPVTFEDGR